MARLSDLLRYKKEVPIIINGKQLATVWVRVIGDADLQDAYRAGRIASSRKRKSLKDSTTEEYQDELGPIDTAEAVELINLICTSRQREFESLADVEIERPDQPELDTVAVDADAPTLEEQEKFDALLLKVETDYQQAKKDYVQNRLTALRAEFEQTDIEMLRDMAKVETTNLLSLTSFLTEVQDQKTFRSVYSDKLCKQREFESIEEFRDTKAEIRDILYQAYADLEINGDDVKN